MLKLDSRPWMGAMILAYLLAWPTGVMAQSATLTGTASIQVIAMSNVADISAPRLTVGRHGATEPRLTVGRHGATDQLRVDMVNTEHHITAQTTGRDSKVILITY